jgi:hypothetical protein
MASLYLTPQPKAELTPATGSRPNTLLEGELDKCGGHAGRGDDYHYHIAPVCLIEQLGKERIDDKKQPIGFAMDGYPIHALGWFDNANNIEDQLDECRGYTDSKGRYFYNVMTQANWDILTCFTGKPKRFAKDKWAARKDKNGNDIVGYPVKFDIKNYSAQQYGAETCHVVTGTIPKEQLLRTNGSTIKINDADGSIFYCNPSCYAMFFEADKKPQFKGRVIYYERVTDKCPARFSVSDLILFEAYEGPPQTYKAPQSTKK